MLDSCARPDTSVRPARWAVVGLIVVASLAACNDGGGSDDEGVTPSVPSTSSSIPEDELTTSTLTGGTVLDPDTNTGGDAQP